MKKIILYIAVLFFTVGCDVLDISPKNMISEEAVISDPELIDAYLNSVYNKTRLQTRGNNDDYSPDQAILHVASGEANVYAAWEVPLRVAMEIIDENGANATLEYWPYGNIRSANEIIEMLKGATFDEDIIIQKTAEARWLRAFMYFEMVKRYGGVPIITEPQSIDASYEELYVPRNTEQEVYDFIASEMDDLVDILPDSYDLDNFGRPTKWAAYALKSRAMLYAGSIGKYGSIQLDGILGIPEGESDDYYKKAYDAAMAVINGGMHPLYEENPNPEDNYGEIFTVEGNSEIILAEVFDLGLLKTHSWDFMCAPDGFRNSWGTNNWMYLESWEKYEYQDGSSGKLDWSTLDGKTKYSLDELLLNKDPRFLATAFYPEAPWQGGTVYFHSSTVGTIPEGSDWPDVAPNRNRIKAGMLIKKRVDESVKLPREYEDGIDWIVFRTGEMYLNAAEAAFEMGNVDEAKRLINIIRNRAGMPDKETLTFEDIKNERFVELYIEEHHYWDLRRWRIAEEVLNGNGFHGVIWTYYIDEDKYTLKLKDADFGQIRTFAERNYYFPIGLGRIADNPNLVENPGY